MAAKVWIVDDDSSIRWVLERALSAEGFECQSFEDGDRQLARQGQQLLDESLQQALASPPPAAVPQ